MYAAPGLIAPRSPLQHIGAESPEALGVSLFSIVNVLATSQNYPAANVALYIPFGLAAPFTVRQLGIHNGTAVAGNIDIGVFDVAGNRLCSTGSTAQAGTSTIQWINATAATLLSPGRYYLGVTSDTSGVSQKIVGWNVSNAAFLKALGVLESANGPALPNPVTFVTITRLVFPGVWISALAAN